MPADYAHITRDQVLEQWKIWNSLNNEFKGFEMYSCLGDHDLWWAATEKSDAMYGKNYVVDKMEMSHRYYSFTKGGWCFIVLDSNNDSTGSLDKDQRKCLEHELNSCMTGLLSL